MTYKLYCPALNGTIQNAVEITFKEPATAEEAVKIWCSSNFQFDPKFIEGHHVCVVSEDGVLQEFIITIKIHPEFIVKPVVKQ